MNKPSSLLRVLDSKHRIRSLQSIEIYGSPVDNCVIDLSDWMLQFSDNTRVLQLRAPAFTDIAPCQLADTLEARVGDRDYPHLIVLLEGDASALRKCLREEHDTPPIVVLGSDDQTRIAGASNPSDALRNAVVSQLPISLLTPYETAAVVQGNRFFGRKRELRSIVQNPNKSYAVIGIRRIGKTSLMRELERRLNKTGATLYIDCSRFTPYDLMYAIASELHPRSVEDLRKQYTRTFFPTMMKTIRGNSSSCPIILLDEIDDLIASDSPSFELFDMMRQMSQNGICQFIFAGHRLLWRAHHNEKSPFYNWTQRVDLKPFAREDAEVLVNGPMKSMGVAIEEGVVQRIYRETGGHPNLLQYYCKIMAEQLDSVPQKVIHTAAFDGIYGNADFRQRLVSSFLHNTSLLEQALIYAIVLEQERDQKDSHTPMDREYITKAVKDNGIHAEYRDVYDALDLLVLAGVLLQTNNDSFRFNFPVFARMLSDQKPSNALAQIKAEGL